MANHPTMAMYNDGRVQRWSCTTGSTIRTDWIGHQSQTIEPPTTPTFRLTHPQIRRLTSAQQQQETPDEYIIRVMLAQGGSEFTLKNVCDCTQGL